MKDLLRKCYQEAGIKGANATRFENRAVAMQRILDEKDFFSKEEWTLLAKWAIGATEDSAVEDQVIDLEEAFCETDSDYTKENTKELHILVEILLYQHCKETEDILLSSIVVCGYGIGWRLKSNLMYEKFLALTNEARSALQQLDQYMRIGLVNTRVSLRAIKVQLEPLVNEDEDEEADAKVDIDQLATDLEAAEEQIHDLRL